MEMVAGTIDRRVAHGPFSLEDWLVEPELNCVSNGETSVHLEPKAMEVLVCLAEHAGVVVPRQLLVDHVWSTEFITDSTLTHAVADLRRALEDDARAPRFIETIPKRGYRLVAEVGAGGSASATTAKPRLRCGPLAVIVGMSVRLDNGDVVDLGSHFLFLGDHEIPLPGRPIFFGRDQKADIQILAPEVSRRHARLDVDSEIVVIEDLGSKNGTLVNDERIDHRRRLVSGDAIGIGPTTLIYRSLANDPTRTQQGD
jgi:DNA-binding winged helix-turn-helix (wHTH) protein